MEVATLRLLHLVSPALPIGAYAYSQGLEHAVHAGWVRDEATAASWILGLLEHALGRLEVPVLARLTTAWRAGRTFEARRWSDFVRACRGAAELQGEEQRLGSALARVLVTLGLGEAEAFVPDPRCTHLAMFALACARWGLADAEAAGGYLFAWCESQVGAACRLVPLGQSAGQRIIGVAVERIPGIVAAGLVLADEDVGATTPGQALASAIHETQYSRIFRS